MLPVLYYHRVGPFRPGAPRKMNVEPDTFRRHVEFLLRRRYAFVTLDDVISGVPGKAVALTFDDGYRDLMEHAVPLLARHGIRATFFIVAGAVGGTDHWYRSEDRIMSWDDLRALLRAGHLIGSHTLTHPPLTTVSPDVAHNEIAESRRLLESQLAGTVRHFAYPQGLNSPALTDAVRQAGYAAGWATKSGDGSPFARRRFRIPADLSVFNLWFKLVRIRAGLY